MGTETLEVRLAQTNEQIADLRLQLSGLQRARGEVANDSAMFLDQLGRKRGLANQAAEIGDSRVASGYGRAMQGKLGSGFQASVLDCFDGMCRDIDRAICRVHDEISQAQYRASVLQEDIADERERMRLAEERKRNEALAEAKGVSS